MKQLTLKSPTKTLATVGPKTIEAKVEVLPRGQLSTEVRGKKGGEIVLKKDGKGGPVVVAGGNQTTTTSQDDGSRRGNPNAAGVSTLKGLVRADRMVELLTRVAGYDLAAAESTIGEHVLSWSNKRRRQTLADGGSVQRRLRGTGFDGANNKGFVKGRGSEKPDGKASEGGQSSEDFKESVRKRWEKKPSGDLPTVTDAKAKPLALGDAPTKAKPLALGDAPVKAKPLALGDAPTKAKPLALGDAPKPPKRSAGSMGIADGGLAGEFGKGIGGGVGDGLKGLLGDAAKDLGKTVKGGATQAYEDTPHGQMTQAALATAKAQVSKVKDLWKAGKKTQAITAASKYYVPGMSIWADAMEWIERRAGL